MPATPKKSRGSFQRAFLKGLSIILPAVITIAIFAWVWGILRVNVVELIIRGVDSIKVYGHRSGELNKKELLHLEDRFFHAEGEDALRNGKPYDPVPAQDRTNENLRRTITLADLPAKGDGRLSDLLLPLVDGGLGLAEQLDLRGVVIDGFL